MPEHSSKASFFITVGVGVKSNRFFILIKNIEGMQLLAKHTICYTKHISRHNKNCENIIEGLVRHENRNGL